MPTPRLARTVQSHQGHGWPLEAQWHPSCMLPTRSGAQTRAECVSERSLLSQLMVSQGLAPLEDNVGRTGTMLLGSSHRQLNRLRKNSGETW